MKKWYACKRDIAVTAGVAVLAFLFDSSLNNINIIKQAVNQIVITPYFGFILGFIVEYGYVNTMIFMLLESLFIHLEHYWQWTIIALFSTTAARILGQDFLSADNTTTVYEFIWELIVNSFFYLPVVMLVIVLVFFCEKKNGRRRSLW